MSTHERAVEILREMAETVRANPKVSAALIITFEEETGAVNFRWSDPMTAIARLGLLSSAECAVHAEMIGTVTRPAPTPPKPRKKATHLQVITTDSTGPVKPT